MRRVIFLMVVVVLGLGACSSSAPDRGSTTPGLRGLEACAGTPTPVPAPKFPAGFPSISDVTWSRATQAGPSLIVEGYTGDALESLFNEMTDKFSQNGYSVIKSERDPHDAEVNFKGAKNEGQVRLAEECQGRTTVTLTIRPLP